MIQKILESLNWIGTTLVVSAAFILFFQPEQQELGWWLFIIGIAFISLYAIGKWKDILRFFSGRKARYGTLATSGLLLGLGILIGTNYILARQNKRWDLTAAKQYSLSDQTVRILESLESPIKIMVFAQEFDFPRYRDRLDEYEYTSSQVSIDYIDVDKDPLLARQYEIASYGTVVFDYNGRIERVVSDQEQELTNALIKAIEGEESLIYFVQGHGERQPNNTEPAGYSSLTESLRLDNITTAPIVLAQTRAVPLDAAALVIAGPSTDLLSGEIDILRKYLEVGGKILVLLDPPNGPDAPKYENLTALLAEWNINVGQNMVVDISGLGQILQTDATVPVAAMYPPHAITERFGLLTAFPLARSVTPMTSEINNRVAETFVQTSPRSWAENNLEELVSGELTMDENQGDIPGPISIAVALSVEVVVEESNSDSGEQTALNADTEAEEETSPPTTRVAVFGDSDFASNGALGIQGNRDLMLNTINWLAQQENLIAIRPRQVEDRRITLTANQQFRIMIGSLFLIPIGILGTGVYVWWRRR